MVSPYRSQSSDIRSWRIDHQGHADAFFLVLAEVAVVHPVQRGTFHQLTQ